MQMRALLPAALCAAAAAAGACTQDAPGQTFFDRNIEPILSQKCAGTTSGCHQTETNDSFGFAAGNLDVTSYESIQRRRDVLQPFGVYSYPLLLIKAVGPNVLTFNYGGGATGSGSGSDSEATPRMIEVQHTGGAVLEVDSDAFLTLQNWLGNGATENGLPPATPAQMGTGACSTAIPEGFDPSSYQANAAFAEFKSSVQPVFTQHGCNAASCHGAPQSDFYITCGTDDTQLAFNFSQAWSFVNSPVADSEILRVPLAVSQGGRGHTGGDQFSSTTDPDYVAIATWATAVGVLDFAAGSTDPGKAFFRDNVQPILIARGCSFEACHSPEATNDFKLRSGTPQGFYSAISLQKNYDLLLQNFMAIEVPDARRGRAVAKTILSSDSRAAGQVLGITHRGGAVLETPSTMASDPALCPQPFVAGGSNETVFCTVQEWLRIERANAGLPAMASGDTLPIVYVSRTQPAAAGRLEFDTFEGGADLLVANATLTGEQTIASVGAGTSLLSGCAGLTAGTADVQSPDVGPDGKTVAFAARNSATAPLEIYTVDISGTGCTQITQTEPDANGIKIHNFDPSWSPDGTYIIYASTHGGSSGPALSRKRMLPESDLWRVQVSTGPGDGSGSALDGNGSAAAIGVPEQMTFLSNSEVTPHTMREGRVTMTTEKVGDSFYQLSGRRMNWDLTDYHPLLAQRNVSPYADPTNLATTLPSIGFDAATDIREGTDGSFLIILSDVGSDGTPVLAGGAGALATFNRSIGPFEQDRAGSAGSGSGGTNPQFDNAYAQSLTVIDPSGNATGHSGATEGYRHPVTLPDGQIMVSFTSNVTAPTWSVVSVNPVTKAQTTLIANAVDAVLAYPYPPRALFDNRRQLVFGGSFATGDPTHAILHMPDAPMVFTLLTGNLRRGHPVDAFRKATHLKVFTGAPCPAATSCPANMAIGEAALASDGSVRVQLPAKTPLVFALVDDSDNTVVTMTEEHQLAPGESISMGVSQSLFNSVCAGCHGSVSGLETDVGVSADALTGASQSLSATATPATLSQ